ncbi:hypothetical protein HGM15179_010909, partial [Zosterops borbonicus]
EILSFFPCSECPECHRRWDTCPGDSSGFCAQIPVWSVQERALCPWQWSPGRDPGKSRKIQESTGIGDWGGRDCSAVG